GRCAAQLACVGLAFLEPRGDDLVGECPALRRVRRHVGVERRLCPLTPFAPVFGLGLRQGVGRTAVTSPAGRPAVPPLPGSTGGSRRPGPVRRTRSTPPTVPGWGRRAAPAWPAASGRRTPCRRRDLR